MPKGEELSDNAPKLRRLIPRTRRSRIGLGVLIGLLVGIILAWTQRETIADDLISSEFAKLGIDAKYEIVSIGPRRQILRNVVVGDEGKPDLTIEEVEVAIFYGFGTPGIGGLKLTNPHLLASYDQQDGLSFGALDVVIFAESEEPAGLPDFDLEVSGGAITFQSAQGNGRLSFAGQGGLADGFQGSIGGTFNGLSVGNCRIADSSLEGSIRVIDRQPRFEGPLMLGAIACEANGMRTEPAIMSLVLVGDRDLAGFSGKLGIKAGAITQGSLALANARGDIGVEQRDGILVAKFNLAGSELNDPQFSTAGLDLSGELRTQNGADRLEIRGQFAAQDLRPGAALLKSIDDASNAAVETLAQPLLVKFRTALAAESKDSSFAADFLFRRGENGDAVIVPQAMWRSAAGDSLASLSQLQFALIEGSASQISGNLISGGKDMPRLTGRMEQEPSGKSVLRMRMEPYSSGNASLAVPDMAIAQADNGGFGLSGKLIVTGQIPGGEVSGLSIPIQGGWAESGAMWLWRNCTSAKFDRFESSGMILEDQELRLCPSNLRPIFAYGQGGARLELSIPQQAWVGKLNGEDSQIGLMKASFSSEEGFSASNLKLISGEGQEATRFALRSVDGSFGENIEGSFEGGEFALGPVPFDFSQGSGRWTFANGLLSVSETRLLMDDRINPRRFNTMLAQDFTLTLESGIIRTQGTLRNAETNRAVADIALLHELVSGNGFADLTVRGLTFDEELQPEQLSDLALGVIALADGTLTGAGRIDWADGVITSSGELSTQKFDFAAEFGPVQGVSGTVRFSNLVDLTSEPDQRLKIASINPGIEVFDGEMTFELRETTILSVKQGIWPFLGGTLKLRPVDLNFGAVEERRYIIEIMGADAAQFIATMELNNLAATGTFDGTLPLVFDEFGNGRIEGGLLISRPPGGNLSYVGELTYEDLSAIGNFAFATLRSLDYSQMMVELNGPLTGEIVTSLRFDGVRQGEGASKNIVTRQIAKLPIQFYVNVRAPFYQLLTSFQSMYDPSFIRDPRDLGLLDTDGTRFVRPDGGDSDNSDEPLIQRQESEQMP